MNIVMIGSGNVATHFSPALKNAGHTIIQVFSRSESSASILSAKLNCPYTTDLQNIATNVDLYIFAVKDDALQDVIRRIPRNSGIWIHTAGSIPMNIFDGYSERYGVIYPLQTLSGNRIIDFRKIPLFIEANNVDTEIVIKKVATSVSTVVNVIDSEKRKYLHLAAVFACNFTNYLYAVAAKIIDKQGIDWHVLQPLIDETAAKLYALTPVEAQTGPAVRNDRKTMERHLEIIDDEEIKRLYKVISKNILTLHSKNPTI